MLLDELRPDTSGHNSDAPSTASTECRADSKIIDLDVLCPECDYNLRGLPGPIVQCPECGLESDVPALAGRQWDKPWFKAPGFNTLFMPAVLTYFSFFLLTMVGTHNDAGLGLIILFIIIIPGLWCWLMYKAYCVFNGPLGLLYALAGHVLLVGIFGSLFVIISQILMCVVELIDGHYYVNEIPELIIMLAIASIVFWVCRILERAIARACIRQYLRHTPTK